MRAGALAVSDGYARLPEGTALHRALLGDPPGLDVDHINGNRLDNRKENLRAIPRSVNNMNSAVVTSASGYRGVLWHGASRRWAARLKYQGKVISLGYHKTPELANMARLHKERELFGIQPQRRQFFVDAGLIAC